MEVILSDLLVRVTDGQLMLTLCYGRDRDRIKRVYSVRDVTDVHVVWK